MDMEEIIEEIMGALQDQNENTMRELVKNSPSIISSIFLKAIHQDDLDTVNFLMHCGFTPNTQKGLLYKAIHITAKGQNPKAVKLLLDLNANTSETNVDGDTPLHIACGRISYNEEVDAIVQHLTFNNLSINTQNNDGNTALHLASVHLGPNIVQTLLDCNADPAMFNNEGNLPINLTSDDKVKTLLDNAQISGACDTSEHPDI